jgi:hypothetical protein
MSDLNELLLSPSASIFNVPEALDAAAPEDADIVEAAGRLLEKTRAGDSRAEAIASETFRWLAERSRVIEAVVRNAARFLATETPSAARVYVERYLLEALGRDRSRIDWVRREFNEANYATSAAKTRATERRADGWEPFNGDWPIADLMFEFDAHEDIDRVLHTVRTPLLPVHQRVQYYLLHRIQAAPTTTLERLSALGSLVRLTRSNESLRELHARALLVFRHHWGLLPMGELTRMAAEVYGELCLLAAKFQDTRMPVPLPGIEQRAKPGAIADSSARESN